MNIVFNNFLAGWAKVQVSEVPGGGGLWGGGGGLGHSDQGEGGHQENFSFWTSDILSGDFETTYEN